jgi:pre-mRNA-processing factor SLU7
MTAAKLSAPRRQGLIGNITSKYPENEFTDSHTAIWGSAYDLETGLWGYKCCLSYSQNAGQKCGGIPARQAVINERNRIAYDKQLAIEEAERLKRLEEEQSSDSIVSEGDSSSSSSDSENDGNDSDSSSKSRKKRRKYDKRREKKLKRKQQAKEERKDDKNSSPLIRKRTKKLDEKKV